jgi:hypothetical protein
MPEPLRVTTTIDTSGLRAGMAENVAVTRSAAEQMKASFQAVAEAEIKAAQSSKAASALRAAALAGDKAAITEYAAALQAATAAEAELRAARMAGAGAANVATEATVRGMSQATEARHAIRGLGEEMGVHMPRFVSSYLSSLGGVQPIMAAAFSAVAVVAVVEIVGQLIGKIWEAAQAWMGYTSAAKKAYEEAVKQNADFVKDNLKNREDQRRTSEEGLSGAAKTREHTANTVKTMQDYNTELIAARKHMKDLVEQQEFLTKMHIPDALLALRTDPLHVSAAQPSVDPGKMTGMTKQLEEQQKEIDGLTKSMRDFKEEATVKDPAKLAAEMTAAAEARAQHEIETQKAVGLASLAIYADFLKNRNALIVGELSAEAKEEIAVEQARLKVELDAIDAENKIRAEKRARGETAPDVSKGDANLKSQLKVQQIQEKDAAARLSAMQDQRASVVASQKDIDDARAAVEEKSAADLLAAHKIQISKETDLLKEAATIKHNATLASMEDDRKRAGEGADPNKRAAAVADVDARIEAEKIRFNGEIDHLGEEGARKQAEQDVRDGEERLALAQALAKRALSAAQQSDAEALKHHEISRAEWGAREKAAADRNYAEQVAAFERLKTLLVSQGATELEIRKQVLDKEAELEAQHRQAVAKVEDEQVADWRARIEQMNTALFNGINEWLQGHKRFAAAVKGIWSEMVMDWTRDIEKMAAAQLTQKVLNPLFNATIGKAIGVTLGGNSQQQVEQQNTQAVTQLTQAIQSNTEALKTRSSGSEGGEGGEESDAGFDTGEDSGGGGESGTDQVTAGAAKAVANLGGSALTVFEQVLQVVPFPANLVAAPAAATAVIEMGNSYKSAAGGALVAEDNTPFILHKQEMVLPARESSWIQRAAGGGSGGGVPHGVRFGDINIHGASDTDAVMERVRREVPAMINRAMRYGWKPKAA